MVEHTLPFLDQDEHNFQNIKSGIKTIETRAGSRDYSKIQPGDRLVFVCKGQRLNKIVKEVRHYHSPLEAISSLGLENVVPDADSVQEAVERYQHYPGYSQRLKTYGLLAFILK